jgi:crossover junction endodeoxyribonuclease RuvC
MMEQRILGIDPGLNITGYGILRRTPRGPTLEEAGIVRGGSGGALPPRLNKIHRGLEDVITAFKPTAVAIEQLYSHYQRPRTSILMGHARGVICLVAAQHEIPVFDYAATKVKKLLTGNGRAPKSQMQAAIQRELSLSQLPEPADVADALAIALCHFYLAERKIGV